MHTHAESLRSVGFLHVVEDALALLNGKKLSEERRTYVLKDLTKIISDAKDFSSVGQGNMRFVTSVNRQAYDFFSLLNEEHEINGKPWPQLLTSAAGALRQLAKDAGTVNKAQREAAKLLLGEILATLSSGPREPLFRHVSAQKKLQRA
jgi:hypothetical protein